MNFWLNNRFGIATTTIAQKAKWGVFKLSKHHQISTFSKKNRHADPNIHFLARDRILSVEGSETLVEKKDELLLKQQQRHARIIVIKTITKSTLLPETHMCQN